MPHQAGPLPRAHARLQRDSDARLTRLEAANPEWRPLLAALRETIAALSAPAPAACVDPGTAPVACEHGAPLLHGRRVEVDLAAVERTVQRLAFAAGIAGRRKTRGARLDGPLVLALLSAVLHRDDTLLDALAREVECPTAALRVVGLHALVPLLHPCAIQLADQLPTDWQSGFCPICGQWPVLAELRGLEQARRLRCGRCSADWAGEVLRCPFCGEREHQRLGVLVPGTDETRTKADTCTSCRGYLKSLATLVPLSATELLLFDLESVELDLAARAAGFYRPEGPGFRCDITLVPRGRPAKRARLP